MGKSKIPIVGSNHDGTKLYCFLKRHSRYIVKGYYCFTDEKLHVKSIAYSLLEEGETIKSIVELYAAEAYKEYDWDIIDVIFDNNDNKGKSSRPVRRRRKKGRKNNTSNVP